MRSVRPRACLRQPPKPRVDPSPEASAKQSRYNDQGQVTQTVNALVRLTTLTYDTSGRVTLEQFADGTSETSRTMPSVS